jgi:hypothetical protein
MFFGVRSRRARQRKKETRAPISGKFLASRVPLNPRPTPILWDLQKKFSAPFSPRLSSNMSSFVGATAKLLPAAAKIVRNKRAASLFDVLFRYKNFGVGTNVYRYRWKKYWTKPDVPDCYVTITRVKVKRRVRPVQKQKT